MSAAWNHSIRGKLTGIMMLTSTIAVLLACLGFVTSDLVNLRNRLSADLLTLAEVIGSNSTAALTFSDRPAAEDVLNALRAKPAIIAACIYTDKGVPFALYAPSRSTFIPKTPGGDGLHQGGGGLELVYPIELDHHRIGTLYIASDFRDRTVRLKQYAMIAAGIVLASLLIAFLLSSWLQRGISQPIVELANIADYVSKHKNFTVRASPPAFQLSNEIGNLMTGFNGMLAEIEQRDDRLLMHQTTLEHTVALRTSELTTAKNKAETVAERNAQLAQESALILNTATDGIMGVDLNNEPSFLNPAAARMLGRSLGEFKGRTSHALFHHTRADGTHWPETDCPLAQALSRGEPFAIAEDIFWRADGSSFPVEYTATPMVDEHGRKLGAVVMFRDITERRAIERLKSEFVSTVSHELRTPLTSIRGALGLLNSGLLGPIAEKGQRMLAIAVTNTDRLVRLINDILDLERIDSGKVELVRGPLDPNTIMIQTVEGLQSMADEAGVHLVVEPVTATLWGDSDRIIQTLTNLLGNAIKFSPRDTTVTLSGAPDATDFVFCVADEGRGVPEEKLQSIFDRFSQVDASDSRDKGGSGLGLAICESIVKAHGGHIWAEKNEPAGSRFQFTIPLRSLAPVALPAIDAATGGSGWQLIDRLAPASENHIAAPLILIVEDDRDLARVMMAALENRGMITAHTARGSDAIRFCMQRLPSLIVLDLVLADMDGFEVVSALRRIPRVATIPLLMYSALDVGSADQARLRLGPTEFLTKSRSSLTDFEARVVRLLEVRTAQASSASAA